MHNDVATDVTSTKLLLVTQYDLRLQASHDGTVEISYIPDLQCKRKTIPSGVDGCNLDLLTLNTVTPFSDSKPSPPFCYDTSFSQNVVLPLWYKDFLDSPHVDADVLEVHYPRLAKTCFEWVHIYYDACMPPDCCFGIEAEVFPEADEDIAWGVEGFLLACWQALQGDVWEVQDGDYDLRKGRPEEELVRLLMNFEKADQSDDSSVE